jgi:hypothetical protein
MEGYKNITREDLVQILDAVRDSIVALNFMEFIEGMIFFNKFDYGIYINKDGETVLSLTSEEMEDSWDLYLDGVEEMWVDEFIDMDEITYEELCGDAVYLKFFNDVMVSIEF